jgi:hypothetical protein
MDLALQWLLIGLALAASVAYVLRRQFPEAAARVRRAAVLSLLRPARPQWLRQLGRRLAPPARVVLDGCGGCSDRACGGATPSR